MYVKIKRILDIMIAILGLPVLGAVILISAICIKKEDGGPVLYMADRTGKDGKPFKMYKIRSMKVNSPDIRLEDGSTYNGENDPRVTKYGKFIRKTSLDEIPQIINVLKGEMSFIGPRPDSVSYLTNYTKEERKILKVRPGITGYNQAVNRNSVGTKEKLRNDIYYVDNMSAFLDMKIVFMTLKIVFTSKNVYRT